MMTTEEKLSIALDALNNIAHPIKHLQISAEKEGKSLNGGMAVMISQDPAYLKSIAESALSKIPEDLISKLKRSIEERIKYLTQEDDEGCSDRCDELREVLFWINENNNPLHV